MACVVRLSALLSGCLVFVAASEAGAEPGNAWHIPTSEEPGGVDSMRDPVQGMDASTAVMIWSGNQFQGAGGNPGNQLQTGSSVFSRVLGTPGWDEHPLTFSHTNGNNIYYSTEVGAGTYAPGDTIEYYLQIPYSDHDTTFVYGSDNASDVAIVEGTAQADPYVYVVQWPLQPEGDAAELSGDVLTVRVYEDSGHLEIVGPGHDGADVSLVYQPARFQIGDRWYNAGRVLSVANPSDGTMEVTQEVGPWELTARIDFGDDPNTVRYDALSFTGPDPTQTAIAAASPDDEHFYGFGEKFNVFDQAGNTVHVVTSDPAGNKGDLSYKSAPFFHSTRGYGMWLDSPAESWFDMRDTASDRFTVTNNYDTLGFEVFWGPQLADVLERYTAVTGRPPRPPAWAFAPWMSSDHWRDGGEVRYVVSRYVEEGIPGSVFVFDSPWETAYNDFTWNMTQFSQGGNYGGQDYEGFASVGEMMTFLQDHGFRVVLWMTPFLNTSSYDEGVPGQNLGQSGNYAEAQAMGYLVRDGAGGPPLEVEWWKGTGTAVDFTSAGARTWFQAQLQALVDESNGVVGGWKIDDGEGAFIPSNAAYSDGTTGVERANTYTTLYHETVFDVLGSDGILFSRSGYTGTHAYPGCWAGDNEPNFGEENGLPSVIVAGQTAAMSGYAIWGHDIGGYQETNMSSTPENLFMRWTQFGALSPLMQMHRQVGMEMQYPWSFGDEGLSNYRKFARLHTALFPYVYTYADVAAQRGLPIIRPLVLHFADDPNTWPVQHTYLFGDWLLAAPMLTNEQTERELYLPEGTWYDWWTLEPYDGEMLTTWTNDDQSEFPLFVRDGAIVPMLSDVPQTLLGTDYVDNPDVPTPTDDWTILLVPGPDATAMVAYDGTTIDLRPGDDAIEVEVSGAARLLRLDVLVDEVPLGATWNGDALDEQADIDALDGVDMGWAPDGPVVVVKVPHRGESLVRLEYEPSGADDDGGTVDGTSGDDASNTGTSGGASDVSATVTVTASDTGADGVPADGGDGATGGCGCSNPGRPATAWLVLLVLVTLALRRRAA